MEEEEEDDEEVIDSKRKTPSLSSTTLTTNRVIPGLCVARDPSNGESRGRPFYYQENTLEKILKRPKVILALDMGLGKTLTTGMTISYEMAAKKRRNEGFFKTLVVCPLIVMNVWVEELASHFEPGTFRIFTLTQKKRSKVNDYFEEIITSPPDRMGYDIYILPYGWIKSKFKKATEILGQHFHGRGRGETSAPKKRSGSGDSIDAFLSEFRHRVRKSTTVKKKPPYDLWKGLTIRERRKILGGGVFSLFTTVFDMLVCDEAHEFNNRSTLVFKSIDAILTRGYRRGKPTRDRRQYLTGSPQENSPRELRNLMLSLTGPIKAEDLKKIPMHTARYAGMLLIHNEKNWDQAIADSMKRIANTATRGLAYLMDTYVIRMSKNQYLRKSVCERPGSSHQKALAEGRPVPKVLLEDVLVKKNSGLFKSDIEIQISNFLLAIAHDNVQTWRDNIQKGVFGAFAKANVDQEPENLSVGRKAMANPLSALLIMRMMSFSPTMFDPIAIVRGKNLKADHIEIVSETWTYDFGGGVNQTITLEDEAILSNTYFAHSNTLEYRINGEDRIRTHATKDLVLTPSMIIEARKHKSTKLLMLEEIIRDMNAKGLKGVVFAHWLAEIGLVRQHLLETVFKDNPDSCIIAFGGHSEEERHDIVRRFREDPNCRVLIANRVLGVGINISFANYMIFGTFGYNPWIEEQVKDRLDRYGQKNKVTIMYLVVSDTVEERVFYINRRKLVQATIVLDGHDTAKNCALADGVVDMAAWGIGSDAADGQSATSKKNTKRKNALQLIDAFGKTKALTHTASDATPLFSSTTVSDGDPQPSKTPIADATALMLDAMDRASKVKEKKAEPQEDVVNVLDSIWNALKSSVGEEEIEEAEATVLGKRKAPEQSDSSEPSRVLPLSKKKVLTTPPPIPTRLLKKSRRLVPPPVPKRRIAPVPRDTAWLGKASTVKNPTKRNRQLRKHGTRTLSQDTSIYEVMDPIEDFSLEDIIRDDMDDSIEEFPDDDDDGYHSSSREYEIRDEIGWIPVTRK